MNTPPPRIVITMEGGLVQAVLSNIAVDVLVIDYDTEGTTDPTVMIPQSDGTDEEAVTTIHTVLPEDRQPERVNQLFTASEQ